MCVCVCVCVLGIKSLFVFYVKHLGFHINFQHWILVMLQLWEKENTEETEMPIFNGVLQFLQFPPTRATATMCGADDRITGPKKKKRKRWSR